MKKPVPVMEDGIPLCSESCPAHDGKRCELTGFRPDRLCEPEVRIMALQIRALARMVAKLVVTGQSPACPLEEAGDEPHAAS